MKSRLMWREIMAIAVPAIVANITTPLLSLMDVAITGHLGGADYIAAIAVGGTLFNVIYWLMGFLRMGTSGLTAQAYGAADHLSILLVLTRSLVVSATLGVAILLLSSPLCRLGLHFMDVEGATLDFAGDYFMICIWGAPAVLSTFSLTGWFIGMQDSRSPMVVSIFINVVNIAVSLTLTAVVGMKIEGVAIGTLSAQWAGLLLSLWLMWRKTGCTHHRVTRQMVLDRRQMSRFFSVNRDIFLRTACMVAVTLWFTRSGSMQGAQILAANTLLMQLFTLFSYFMDGFAYSGEALCGRFHGAGDNTGLHRCVRLLMLAGLTFTIVFTSVTLLAGRDGLALLTSDHQIVDDAMKYFLWAAAVPACGFLAFTFDGVCIGLTHTRSMLQSVASASVLFFAAWWWMMPRWGNAGLWAAFLLYLAVRSIMLTIICHRLYHNGLKTI